MDECQGTKFEDVLLAFSTAILRRDTLSQRRQGTSIDHVQRIATSTAINNEDMSQLQPLILTHSHAIREALRHKELDRVRIQGLEAYILFKELSLQVENESAAEVLQKSEERLAKAGVDAATLKKKIRHGTPGDETWLNIALSGEPDGDRDAMVEDSFDSMWKSTIAGDDFQKHPSIPSGLLHDFKGQVDVQRGRLDKLRVFQKQVSERNANLIIPKTPTESPIRTPRNPSQRSSSKVSPSKSGRKPGSRLVPLSAGPTKGSAPDQEHQGLLDGKDSGGSPSKLTEATASASRGLNRALSQSQPSKSTERKRLMPSPLKRATSTRTAPRSTMFPNGEPLRESLYRASTTNNLRSEAKQPSNISKPLLEPFDPRGVDESVGRPTLADRAKASMMSASKSRQTNVGIESMPAAEPVLKGNKDGRSLPSPIGRRANALTTDSPSEKTRALNTYHKSPEVNRTRPQRIAHRRSKSHDVRKATTYPVDVPVDPDDAELPNPIYQSSSSELADQHIRPQPAPQPGRPQTPPDQRFEALDADSIFKPRTRLQRSPPPTVEK